MRSCSGTGPPGAMPCNSQGLWRGCCDTGVALRMTFPGGGGCCRVGGRAGGQTEHTPFAPRKAQRRHHGCCTPRRARARPTAQACAAEPARVCVGLGCMPWLWPALASAVACTCLGFWSCCWRWTLVLVLALMYNDWDWLLLQGGREGAALAVAGGGRRRCGGGGGTTARPAAQSACCPPHNPSPAVARQRSAGPHLLGLFVCVLRYYGMRLLDLRGRGDRVGCGAQCGRAARNARLGPSPTNRLAPHPTLPLHSLSALPLPLGQGKPRHRRLQCASGGGGWGVRARGNTAVRVPACRRRRSDQASAAGGAHALNPCCFKYFSTQC